jgi:transposase
MRKDTRYLGLDVHAATIAVAIAEGRGEVRSLGTIANRPEAIQKLLKKLGDVRTLHACYEAGPTGYVLYWQLTKLGVQCEVIAPSLVPVRSADRVKTDRRDAEKLARALRAGDLTAVFVPDAEHEALRDLVRTREATKTDELRARPNVAPPARSSKGIDAQNREAAQRDWTGRSISTEMEFCCAGRALASAASAANRS